MVFQLPSPQFSQQNASDSLMNPYQTTYEGFTDINTTFDYDICREFLEIDDGYDGLVAK